jgi:hypothetical protein
LEIRLAGFILYNATYAGVDEHTEGVSRSSIFLLAGRRVRKEIHQSQQSEPGKRCWSCFCCWVSVQAWDDRDSTTRDCENPVGSGPWKSRRHVRQSSATGCHNLQSEIDNRMELARMWKVTDRNDPLFVEIASLMSEKVGLINSFKAEKERLNRKRIATDEMIQNAFIPRSRWSPSISPNINFFVDEDKSKPYYEQ